MAYIKRDIEDKILALSKEYSCILITGPRQVGKTTVLMQLMDSNRGKSGIQFCEGFKNMVWRTNQEGTVPVPPVRWKLA